MITKYEIRIIVRRKGISPWSGVRRSSSSARCTSTPVNLKGSKPCVAKRNRLGGLKHEIQIRMRSRSKGILSLCVLCGSPVWPSPPVVGPLRGPLLCVGPLWAGSLPCRVVVSRGICSSSCLALARTLSQCYVLYIYIYTHTHIYIYIYIYIYISG